MNKDWPVKNLATATVESMAKWERKEADFYPTPAPGTLIMAPLLDLPPGARIAEPACGSGEMAYVLRHAGYRVDASDIRKTGYGEQIDFLTSPLDRWRGYDACCTNPPFREAERFVRRATVLFPVVALLLKANFFHAGSRIKLWDDCTPTDIRPVAFRLAFLEEERGSSPLMDCSWFIWDKSKPKLACRPLPRPAPADLPPAYVTPLLVHLARLEEGHENLARLVNGRV